MEVSTVPTNAEVNDLINTVMDGTDCIYLDVTMRSENKSHCIQYASSLCRQGEATIWEQQLFTELNKKVYKLTLYFFYEFKIKFKKIPDKIILLLYDILLGLCTEINKIYWSAN